MMFMLCSFYGSLMIMLYDIAIWVADLGPCGDVFSQGGCREYITCNFVTSFHIFTSLITYFFIEELNHITKSIKIYFILIIFIMDLFK